MAESELDRTTSGDAALGLGAFGGDVLFSDPLAANYDAVGEPVSDLGAGSLATDVGPSVLTSAESTNIFANEVLDGYAPAPAPLPAAVPSAPVTAQVPAAAPAPHAPKSPAHNANPPAPQQIPPAAHPSTLGAATPIDIRAERRTQRAQRTAARAKPTGVRMIVGLVIASFWFLGVLGNGIVSFFRSDDSSSGSQQPFSPPPVLSSDASDPNVSGDGSGDSTAGSIDERALPAAPESEVGAPSGTDASGRPEHLNMTYQPEKMPADVGAIRIQLVRTTEPIRVETYVGTTLESAKDTMPGSIYGWETEPSDPTVITMRMRATDPSTRLACGIFVDEVMVGFGRGVGGVLDCVYDPASLKK